MNFFWNNRTGWMSIQVDRITQFDVAFALTAYLLCLLTFFFLLQLYSKKTDKESSTDLYGTKWLKDAILSKRSDNAFRITMVGDPKIRLHEIGIPMELALNLVVSEHVNSYNFKSINSKCNHHLFDKEVLFTRRNGQLNYVQRQISQKLVTLSTDYCRMVILFLSVGHLQYINTRLLHYLQDYYHLRQLFQSTHCAVPL